MILAIWQAFNISHDERLYGHDLLKQVLFGTKRPCLVGLRIYYYSFSQLHLFSKSVFTENMDICSNDWVSCGWYLDVCPHSDHLNGHTVERPSHHHHHHHIESLATACFHTGHDMIISSLNRGNNRYIVIGFVAYLSNLSWSWMVN